VNSHRIGGALVVHSSKDDDGKLSVHLLWCGREPYRSGVVLGAGDTLSHEHPQSQH
jgi:hypothetical protein